MDVESEIEDSVGVTPLVVIPRNNLVEVIVETNSCLGVENGRSLVVHEILRDNFFLGESENSLEFILRGFLDGFNEVSISGGLLELDSEINNGDVDGGNSEGHTSELALEDGEDEADSLGSTSGRWDDVGTGGSSSSPVLSTLGGSIDNELSSGGGVDGSHETFNDSEFVIENLSNGSKAVGSARGIGDNVLRSVVLKMVDTIDISGGVILSGGREDNLLGTTLKMGTSLFLGEESTSRFTDNGSVVITPLNVGGVFLSEEMDGVAIDLDGLVINLLNLSLESEVSRVVLKLVNEIVDGHEGVVDGDNLNLAGFVFN